MNAKILSLAVAATVAGVVLLIVAGAADDADTRSTVETICNKEMIDWWDEMVDSLGEESEAVWTEPDWPDDLWVEIGDIGGGAYRISLFLSGPTDTPIEYTITETENGYQAHGPALQDGRMNPRIYVRDWEGGCPG